MVVWNILGDRYEETNFLGYLMVWCMSPGLRDKNINNV